MAVVDLKSAYRSVHIRPDEQTITGPTMAILRPKTTPPYVWHLPPLWSPQISSNFQLHYPSCSMFLAPGRQSCGGLLGWFFFVFGPDFLSCKATYDALILKLRDLGFQINWKKVVDPCQQLVFLRIQINTMTGRLTLKPEKLPELCMWLTTHFPTMGARITQPTGIFGGKIVLGQPRRALGSHPPHLNICVNFIPKVTNPHVSPWWLTDGSDLVALLANQWGKLATYLVPTTALNVFTDACTDGGGGICCGNLLYAHWAHDVSRLTPHHIGRTCQCANLDHAFTLHCTIPPNMGASTNRWTTIAFSGNFVNNGHRNSIKLSNLWAMCRKSHFWNHFQYPMKS